MLDWKYFVGNHPTHANMKSRRGNEHHDDDDEDKYMD